MTYAEEYQRRCGEKSDIAGHLPWLHDQVAQRPGCRVIELGTRRGNSTSAFLAGVETGRTLYNSGHVWSIDTNEADVPDDWNDLGLWSFLRADALGGEALRWAPRSCHVLFVDLDPHSFEQTVQALRLWWPRVLPGGVAVLHDTEFPEINYLPTPPDESEVGRAITAFCAQRGLEWRNRPGSFGLGVVQQP